MPMSAPRCLQSAAMVVSVSAAAANSSPTGVILVGDRADWGRQREHYVEVRHRQQFGLARCKPCRSGRPLTLRTVPIAAGVIGDARVGTLFAALDMTA